MAKKKIDLSRVKDFLFNHGEKVALGVCGFIAILFGGLKLLDASGAGFAPDTGKPWPEAYGEADRKIKSQMASAQLKEVDMSSMKREFYVWDPIESRYVQSPYSQVGEVNDSKRRNPTALKMLEDPKSFRLDYIRGLVFVHDYDKVERTVKGIQPAGTAAVAPPPPPPKKKGDPPVPVFVPERLKAGRAQSFVVVTGIFPMKQQVEEFRKALKLATQKELFDFPREDLPVIKGINVVRFELTKIGGEPVNKEAEIIVQYDPSANNRKGGLRMQKKLEELLRDAMYDELTPVALEPYLYDGLAMPLPRLAYGRYPKFQFPGWDIAWAEDERKDVAVGVQPPPLKTGGGGSIIGKGKDKKQPNPNPMAPPGPGNGAELEVTTIRDKNLREVDLGLSSRLFGDLKNVDKKVESDFGVFHALGELPPTEEKPAVPVTPVGPPLGKPPRGGMPGPGGVQPPVQNLGRFFNAWDIDPPEAVKSVPVAPPKGGKDAPLPLASYPAWERDAVVRFIDADVQPGKTYSYAIQVRIANPNFKKEDKVAAVFLARVEELQDNTSWVTTPSITIPLDNYLYAVDQHLYDEAANPQNKKDTKLPKDATTFQIHQFAGEKLINASSYAIGDWVIVERQVVRKGERIGAYETVAVPVWRGDKEAFLVPKTAATKKEPEKLGARMEINGNKAPVLVDFAGGRRYKGNNITNPIEEETAVEALILTADGKLRVHNSRDDADAKQLRAQVGVEAAPVPPITITRQERWLTSQNRVREVLQAATPVSPKTSGKN